MAKQSVNDVEVGLAQELLHVCRLHAVYRRSKVHLPATQCSLPTCLASISIVATTTPWPLSTQRLYHLNGRPSQSPTRHSPSSEGHSGGIFPSHHEGTFCKRFCNRVTEPPCGEPELRQRCVWISGHS